MCASSSSQLEKKNDRLYYYIIRWVMFRFEIVGRDLLDGRIPKTRKSVRLQYPRTYGGAVLLGGSLGTKEGHEAKHQD
jgi:hypothetical protein